MPGSSGAGLEFSGGGRGSLAADSYLQGFRDGFPSMMFPDDFSCGEARRTQHVQPVSGRDLLCPPVSCHSKSLSSKRVLGIYNVEECLINDIARIRDLPDCPYRLQQEARSAADQLFEFLPVRNSCAGSVASGLRLQSICGAVSQSGGLFAGCDDSPQLIAGCSAPSPGKTYAACVLGGNMQNSSHSDVRVDDSRNAVQLAGWKDLPINFPQILDDGLKMKDKVGIKSPMTKDGKPAIILSEAELFELARPLQLSLIGKFPSGRPKWHAVTKFFSSLNLKGEYKIANLDARHLHIHLQHADDYIRLFSKQFLHINGFLIKFLKWTLDFNVNVEPPICPVWISLPLLGLHLYTQSMLYSIASIYGRPLRLDYATSHWTRTENARILVEMDISRWHSNEIWIGSESNGYVQKVIIENLPRFCQHCRKLGHSNDKCFRIFPELRNEPRLMNNLHPHHVCDGGNSEDMALGNQQTNLGEGPTGEAKHLVSLDHDYCVDPSIIVRGSSMSSGSVPDDCVVQPGSVSVVERVLPLVAYDEVPPVSPIVDFNLDEDPELLQSELGSVDRSPRDSPVNRAPHEHVGLLGRLNEEIISQALYPVDTSFEVDFDLGPNYKDKATPRIWSYSDGDEADPDEDVSFVSNLLANDRRLRIANGIRSPIITRSHTKRERDNEN